MRKRDHCSKHLEIKVAWKSNDFHIFKKFQCVFKQILWTPANLHWTSNTNLYICISISQSSIKIDGLNPRKKSLFSSLSKQRETSVVSIFYFHPPCHLQHTSVFQPLQQLSPTALRVPRLEGNNNMQMRLYLATSHTKVSERYFCFVLRGQTQEAFNAKSTVCPKVPKQVGVGTLRLSSHGK